jgi:hypothetical protein
MPSGSLYLKDQNNNGEYFLAPAYDLINTSIHIQSGSRPGAETYALIDHSFLNDKMKRSYKRIIEERNIRFVRQSK